MKKKSSLFSGIRTHISETRQHIAGLRADFKSRLKHFRENRSVSDQQILTKDFSMVLRAWGIDSVAAIPHVVSILRIRFLIFAGPMAVCLFAALLFTSPLSYMALVIVSLPCLLGVLTTAWRISILKNRHFLPLPHWLLSMLTGAGKRP